MVTEIFFDLQRFADDTLVGSDEGFTWGGGGSFGGTGDEDDPAYLAATGASSFADTAIYLKGTTEGYSFTINEIKDDWEVSIAGDNVIKGDFSKDEGAYGLDGEVTVKVFADGEGFDAPVNESNAYIIADGADVDVTIKAEDYSDEITYTFAKDADVMVYIDENDTAVFTDKATITAEEEAIIDVDEDGIHVGNTGSVTVNGAEDTAISFAELPTDGVVVNGATVKAEDSDIESVAIKLDETGIKGLAFDEEDGFVNVAGDSSFEAISGSTAKYDIATNADSISFDAGEAFADVYVTSGKDYTVDGGEAVYTFDKSATTAAVGINGADVGIQTSGDVQDVNIFSSDADKGIDQVKGLLLNDYVDVENDSDGYTAIFDAADGDEGEVTIQASGLGIIGDAEDMTDSDVTVTVDSSGTKATVEGFVSTEISLLGGEEGATYNFNGDTVAVDADDTVYATVDAEGSIEDWITAEDAAKEEAVEAKVDAYDAKWEEVASLGGASDTVVTRHGNVYDEYFYDLSGISSAVLGFDNDDDDDPVTDGSKDTIVIEGTSPKGLSAALEDAVHVTLTVGDGANAGAVPINIQENESDSVKDVTIDLTDSRYPSTVAVGTEGEVSASHKIYLSDSDDDVNYGYLGEGATGENLLQAGDGDAMLRHDGEDIRASIFGGIGNDTIEPDAKDIVKGGDGADLFLDLASYTVQDYSVKEGDAVVASYLYSLEDLLDEDTIEYSGNKVSFGYGELTLVDDEQEDNAFFHVKVAVLDDDGNIGDDRADVIWTKGAGKVDASAAEDGALILSDDSYVNEISGSDSDDYIYAGADDSILGNGGNDYIDLDYSKRAVVGLQSGGGKDSVEGWMFGFDDETDNKLYVGNNGFNGKFVEGNLVVTLTSGDSMTFVDSYYEDDYLNLLVTTSDGDKKFTAIRSKGQAEVYDDDDVADMYVAEADGNVHFHGVEKDLVVDLRSENYQNIRLIGLFDTEGKATVVGTDARETVFAEGDADAGAYGYVSLGGGNDIIVSGYDEGASNVFYFTAGDGRDSIFGYNHYQGLDVDPQKQQSDLIKIESFSDLHVATYTYEDWLGETLTGDRIVISMNDKDDVVLYEDDGVDTSADNLYRLQIGDNEEIRAEIGYSDGGNEFEYTDEANAYIGAAGKATDTLVVGDDTKNDLQICLDGREDNYGQYKFYRGIGVVDASDAEDTRMTLAGDANDNTIIGGGEGSTTYLWGGAGDNVLTGGDGTDYFVYYQNSRAMVNGGADVANANADVINNYDEDEDFIYLADVTFDDIDFDAMDATDTRGIGDDTVTIKLKNGGSLTVNGDQEETKFAFSNGDGSFSTVTANRSTQSWS